MGIDLEETKAILNDVIKTLRDSQEAFRKAAENVESSDLKFMFMDFSTQRAQFLGELQNEIERLGDPEPRDTGSVTGSLHRGWMKLKAALSSDHDQAIITECERGEEEVIESYGNAMKKAMPRYIRDILERQLEQIGLERAHIRNLKQNLSHA